MMKAAGTSTDKFKITNLADIDFPAQAQAAFASLEHDTMPLRDCSCGQYDVGGRMERSTSVETRAPGIVYTYACVI